MVSDLEEMARLKGMNLRERIGVERGGAARAKAASATRRVREFVDSLTRAEKRDEAVVELLLEDVEPRVMEAEHLQQLHLQAEARARFLEEVRLLKSATVGRLLGSRARNASAMPSRLKREGKLFAVPYKGADLYPAFQIVDGEPHPAIQQILAAFQEESPWTVAMWFQAPSGWLSGKRPMDLLTSEPERVVEAARRTTEPLEV